MIPTLPLFILISLVRQISQHTGMQILGRSRTWTSVRHDCTFGLKTLESLFSYARRLAIGTDWSGRESYPANLTHNHIRLLPPSTGNSTPVTNAASSLANQQTAFPTSKAVANLPNGIPPLRPARPTSLSSPPSTFATIPVSATTGNTALQRTLSLANSAASPRVMVLTAPLEPAYQTRFGRGRQAEMEEMLTKTPLCWAAKTGCAAAALW